MPVGCEGLSLVRVNNISFILQPRESTEFYKLLTIIRPVFGQGASGGRTTT